MPATQNYRLADWHESPFLGGTYDLEAVPDARIFNPESAEDVAQCLLESDMAIDAYRWVLSEKQVEELALDSANTIIAGRRQLKLEREMQTAKVELANTQSLGEERKPVRTVFLVTQSRVPEVRSA